MEIDSQFHEVVGDDLYCGFNFVSTSAIRLVSKPDLEFVRGFAEAVAATNMAMADLPVQKTRKLMAKPSTIVAGTVTKVSKIFFVHLFVSLFRNLITVAKNLCSVKSHFGEI